MRVLQLISSTGYYGAEAVVVNLSKHLNALGAGSTIGVFQNAHRPNLEVAEVGRRQGVKVEILPCQGRLDWGTVRAIRELVQRERIDVIHTHGYKTNLYGYLAARSLPVRRIATCHLWTRDRLRLRLYGILDLLLLRQFDQVVAVSQALADALHQARLPARKISVIDNGVECDSFASAQASADLEKIKAGRLAVGIAGRLTEQKGHCYFFEALKEVLALHPDLLAFVVGDGPLKDRLVAQVEKLGISANVVFTGKREDMAGVYAAMDVVAMPSLYEGMPIVLLEALAAKKAVVATRVGAIPLMVKDQETGLLIEPSDPVVLQKAMIRLIGDAGLRRLLGENGGAFIREQFSAASMARRYLKVYETAMLKAGK